MFVIFDFFNQCKYTIKIILNIILCNNNQYFMQLIKSKLYYVHFDEKLILM